MSVTLAQVASELELKILNESLADWEERQVAWGYCSDLLSVVMSDAKIGNLWITRQIHMNVIAVATLADLAGVVISGKTPSNEVLEKATEEKVPVFYTEEPVFNIAGKLYKLLSACNE